MVAFGLITADQVDRALNQYAVPSFMFNQAVFMTYFLAEGGRAAQSSDYAGDFPCGVGEADMVDPPFSFDLRLVANIGGTGGTAYLPINGGAFDSGLPYGTDNWNNYYSQFQAPGCRSVRAWRRVTVP